MSCQTGFVLSYIKYGERDAIVHCFTKETGFQTYFLKGIFAPKSKKKAYLLPLNELTFTLSDKPSKTEIQLATTFDANSNFDFYTDVKANTMVFFLAEFLKKTLRNENQNLTVYNEIKQLCLELDRKNYRAHFIFLVRMIQAFGIAPLISTNTYLNQEKGLFEDTISHHLFDEHISKLWKEIDSSALPYSLQIDPSVRKQFFDSIMLYCQFHFADFRTPDSLEIVQQIFG